MLLNLLASRVYVSHDELEVCCQSIEMSRSCVEIVSISRHSKFSFLSNKKPEPVKVRVRIGEDFEGNSCQLSTHPRIRKSCPPSWPVASMSTSVLQSLAGMGLNFDMLVKRKYIFFSNC